MSKLTIELCPETGICSIVKDSGQKIDLMPTEVDQLRQSANNPKKSKDLIAQIDQKFSETLNPQELTQINKQIT